MLSIYQYAPFAPRFKEGGREISRSLRDGQSEKESVEEDRVVKPRKTVSESQECHHCRKDQECEDSTGWTLSPQELMGKLDRGGGPVGVS